MFLCILHIPEAQGDGTCCVCDCPLGFRSFSTQRVCTLGRTTVRKGKAQGDGTCCVCDCPLGFRSFATQRVCTLGRTAARKGKAKGTAPAVSATALSASALLRHRGSVPLGGRRHERVKPRGRHLLCLRLPSRLSLFCDTEGLYPWAQTNPTPCVLC